MGKTLPTISSKGASSPEQLLTVSEVAGILHVSRTLIYWLAQHGELPVVRVRRAMRFRMQDVQTYIHKTSGAIPPKRPPHFKKT